MKRSLTSLAQQLTFVRHDKKGEAPKGFFETIEGRFRDRLPDESLGRIEIWIKEQQRGTPHRKGLKISRLNGRFIEGTCQPGDNRTCFDFRALIHSPLDPSQAYNCITSQAVSPSPAAVTITVAPSLDKPTFNPDSFWTDSHLELLVLILDDIPTDNGLIKAEEAAKAVITVIEDSSSVKNPSTDDIVDALKRLITQEKLFPHCSGGSKTATHFSTKPVPLIEKEQTAAHQPPHNGQTTSSQTATAPAEINALKENTAEGNTPPPNLQPAKSPATSQPDRGASFGDLFQNQAKLLDLENSFVDNCDPTGSISFLAAQACLCRFIDQKMGLNPEEFDDHRVAGGLSQLVRRGILTPRGNPTRDHGYTVNKKVRLIEEQRQASVSPSADGRERVRLEGRRLFINSDEGRALLGEALIRESESQKTGGFLSQDVYWRKLSDELSGLGVGTDDFLNLAHASLTGASLVSGGSHPNSGVGFQLDDTLYDLVEQWQPIWDERSATKQQDEEASYKAQQQRAAELSASEKTPERDASKEAKPRRTLRKRSVPTPAPPVEEEVVPSVPATAVVTIASEARPSSTLDSSIAEIEQEMAALEEKRRKLTQLKTVGSALKANPEAEAAIAELISKGDTDGLKKMLGID